MKRTTNEILKLKNMPAAQGLQDMMNKLLNKLEDLRIKEQGYIDDLTFYQLQYRAYLYGELKSQESVLYKQLALRKGEDVNIFPYTVDEEINNG